MNVSRDQLIGQLPPYQDKWIEIHPNQTVKDIIKEVLEAHDEFAPYYNKIALCFDDDSTGKICDNIYIFLKENIRYREESEKSQTSALPTGLLIRGYGDCKHYAGFAAGILDALNRKGKKIKWSYIFASYRILDNTPHHVFIEVDDNGNKIWIDPTPGSDTHEPIWITAKKISAMPLHRNIAGIEDNDELIYINQDGAMGGRPFWQLMPVEGVRGKDGNHGTNPYFTGPFLALQHYLEDPYSVEGTDWNKTADAINAKIATGPAPGHTVNGDFVKWIYGKSMKGWNFYYPMGVQDGYVPDLPTWYPHLLINDDGKLVFDRIYKVDDYMNDEIHAITAWAQSLINDHSTAPYPITPRQVKLYSQGDINVPDDLFVEDRGEGFLKDAFDFAKKIGLMAPRNAFLGLVGINAFGMASKLKNSIYNDDGTPDPDGYTKIMHRWQSYGGDPEKLENTINHGASKKAILGNSIGVVEVAAWVATASAIIAAIMPLVKAILDSKKQKTGIDYNLNPATGQPFPVVPGSGGGLNLPGANDLLNKIKENPLPAVAIGLGGYLLLRKKKSVNGKTGDLLPMVLLGFGIYKLFFQKPPVVTTPPIIDPPTK